jgi:hypothetical protein
LLGDGALGSRWDVPAGEKADEFLWFDHAGPRLDIICQGLKSIPKLSCIGIPGVTILHSSSPPVGSFPSATLCGRCRHNGCVLTSLVCWPSSVDDVENKLR